MRRLLLIPVVFLFSCDSSGDTTRALPETTPTEKDTSTETASSKAGSKLDVDLSRTSGDSALDQIVKATVKNVPDFNKALSSSYSMSQFKGLVGSIDLARLRDLADKLAASLKETKYGDQLLQELRAKLDLVVEKLKEKGIDVSKYTALLKR